jgi:hypothetical protein
MKRKSLFAVMAVIFYCMTLPVNASDLQIAKSYLKRAMVNRDNPKIVSHLCNQAKEYAVCFPEYEYLQLEVCHETGDFSDALQYLQDMQAKQNKAFIIDDYDIASQAARTYHYLHSYREALPFYKKVVAQTDKKNAGDYLKYLSCLFASGVAPSQILPVLQEASALFSNQEFVFYQVLYSVKSSSNPFGEPAALIRSLENNGYATQETQYLKSLLIKNQDELGAFINDLQNKQIDAKWGRDIVYGLLERFTVTDENILDTCMSLWNDYAGNADVRTFRFLSYSPLAEWIKSNEKFAHWTVFTGSRTTDIDGNGKAELVVSVKDGIITNRSEDKNQDSVVEREFAYFDNGKIDKVYTRENNTDFQCYTFNEYDSSLLTAEFIKDSKITERNAFIKGAFVFTENQPFPVLQDNLIDYREEYFDNETVKTKFANAKVVMTEKDRDGDGYFEYRALYESGVIAQAFIDMDKNQTPDMHEVYRNGKLVQCEAGYSNTTGVYYYKEVFAKDGIEKYWDNDKDLKYEIFEKTFSDGLVQSYFDVNKDGIYDYMQEKTKDKNVSVYAVNPDKTKKRKIAASVVKQKNIAKTRGWTVISARDSARLAIPDDISFFDTDSKNASGTFSYKKQKFYFSDGLVKSADFNFRLLRNGEKLFLFDCGA